MKQIIDEESAIELVNSPRRSKNDNTGTVYDENGAISRTKNGVRYDLVQEV